MGTSVMLDVLLQVVAVQTNLAGAVGDCLDRLLVADLAFWVDSEVFNISKPAKIVSLYYERVVIPSIQNISNSINEKNPERLLTSYKGKMNHLQSEKREQKCNNTGDYESHHHVKRDLPFIYQRDKIQTCTAASSTSIISGGKAVDFAAFAAGVLTLVLNVNNNGKT